MSEQLPLDLAGCTAPKPAPTRCKAANVIRNVLLDVLPPGVPPNFRRIVRARFVAARRVVAELEMVDGLPAEVEAWQWQADSWAHKWLRLDGGDLSWEGDGWKRVADLPH